MEAFQAERERERTSRLVAGLLAALLLLSFALRLRDASQGLYYGRYFDEKYTFQNVTSFLKGELRPRQANYLSLSYLPQATLLVASRELHELTGIEALSISSDRTADGYSPTAYLLCRLCNVIYGVLSLWMVYRIGRRLDSPLLGLLAAAVLATFHRHFRSSTEFKPDILVLFLTTVTFYWTLSAAWRPTLGRYLRVGVGIGLAVSAKYTGIGSCLPITAAALSNGLGARRDRRQLGWLLLSGLTAVATFVVLNPFLAVVFKYAVRLVNAYGGRAEVIHSSHWLVFGRQIELLIVHHGWLTALFVLTGTIGLLWRLWRPAREDTAEQRLGWLLVLSLFLGYSLLHPAALTLFRSQNYLPVAPFTSLVAAWAMLETWRAFTRRVPALATRRASLAAWPIALLLLGGQQVAVAYERSSPYSEATATQVVTDRLAPLELRTVAAERKGGPIQLGRNRVLTLKVDRLARLEPAVLDHTDAEVFLASRLDEPAGDFYRRRVERLDPGQVVRVLGGLDGEESVVLLLHPWRRDGHFGPLPFEPTDLPNGEASRLIAPLPPGASPGDVLSALLWAPKGASGIDGLRIEPGGELIPIFDTGRRGRLVTPRFPLRGGQTGVSLSLPPGAPLEGYRIVLYRWQP